MNLAQAVRYNPRKRDYRLCPVAPEPATAGAPVAVREHQANQAKVINYHGRRSLREGGIEVLKVLGSACGIVRFERLRSSLPHVEGSTLQKRLSIMCGRGDVMRYGEQSWRNQYRASSCGYWYGIPGGSTEYST
jgi:hypothetical protein